MLSERGIPGAKRQKLSISSVAAVAANVDPMTISVEAESLGKQARATPHPAH